MTLTTHHNHEVEKGVLGRIIFEGEYLNVCDILEPRHFNASDHRDIYAAYQELFLKFKALPDMQDVIAMVRDRTGKNAMTLLSACQEMGLTCWNVEEKGELLRGLWERRELVKLGDKLTNSPSKPEELISQTMDAVLGLQGTKEAKATQSAADMVDEIKASLEISIESQRSGKPLPGALYTSLTELDAALVGLMPGEVTIFAGRPGMGKTTVLQKAIEHIGKTNPVLCLSLDMPKKAVLKNLACGIAEVDHSKVRAAKINDTEKAMLFEAFDKLKEYNIQFNSVDNRLDKLLLTAKRWRMRNPDQPGVIAIDYVQLIGVKGIGAGDNYGAVTAVAKAMNAMAKDLNVSIILLAQLSRAVENRGGDKRPIMSDLKESGELEQIAQNIVMFYRPEYYQFEVDSDGNSTAGLVEAIIVKNRNGSSNRTVKLQFIPQYCKVADWSGYNVQGFTPVSQFTHQPAIAFNSPIMPVEHVGF